MSKEAGKAVSPQDAPGLPAPPPLPPPPTQGWKFTSVRCGRAPEVFWGLRRSALLCREVEGGGLRGGQASLGMDSGSEDEGDEGGGEAGEGAGDEAGGGQVVEWRADALGLEMV